MNDNLPRNLDDLYGPGAEDAAGAPLPLSIWCNDTEWMIAESEEDAIKVWEETTGMVWADDKPDDESRFEPDNREIWTMYYEDEDDRNQHAPAAAELGKDGDGLYWAKAPQQEWIIEHGRCYFMTTER
jgi:hypothetical protein